MATTKKFRVKHGLDASNNTISFVNDPVSANDAATKNYVDIQVASAPGDVSNTYLTSTFTTNTDFQSYIANTNSRIDTLEAGGTLVTNAYLTSTFTTNTAFQSALANTNAFIATKTDDSTTLATNTALRTLINDRMQVANVQSYVATEIAALVNSAPTTLDTLDELASALGDDANFSTTVLTLIGTKASNSALTSTYVTNTVFQSALANTNSYIDTKANTGMLSAYLEVANASSGAAVTVSNTAPSITANGDLWWDNADGELYIAYSNNWVEAVAQDVTPYTNNASYTSGNTTLTFVRTDGSQYEVLLDLSGVSGEVSNSYLTSTFTTNTDFQSALANTNAFIATKTDDSTVLATNTALRTLIDDRMQVANVQSYVATEIASLVNSAPTTLNTLDELATALGDDANFSTTVLTLVGTKASNATLTSTYVTNTVFQSALANTNSYIATKTDDTVALATNTALRTLIDDRVQVANLNTTLADYWPSANIITYTAKYLEVANSSSGGASITVSNTAPSITANGELWWDNADGELYISYSNNWVEAVAQDVTPYTNNVTYSSSNTTLTFTRTDNSQFDVLLDLSGVSGEVSNSYLTSTFVTNTDFQSALANTNSYIATKTDDSTVLATNTALRTLIDDRMQVANVEAYLANTNSYIATESARIDLVNTNLTGTNTALRTLISDRIQVANAETRFLRKDGTALQSVGGQVTFSDNVIISGNLTVSGTRTEVNTEQLNVSNTYILLNSDLSSGTAATENAGLIVNRGSEANVYFRWNETEEYWEYGEADGTFTSVTEASATIINARNESGAQIDQGAPVYVSGYSGGGARPLVELADADDPSKMSAIGLALETVTTGNNIRIASYGVFENANTGVFSEGQELYVDTTAGKLTGTRPLGDSAKIQKIGKVLRSHASAGTILIQGAGRSNDIPNLPNLNVFIGNTSGVGTTRQLQYSDLSDVGYVTANTISIKNPANYHEYAITVDTKTSAHPYSGGSSSAYFLDGVESPSIVLAPNQTYRFDQSDSTNSSHPLDFYVDADKNTAYTTGVTVSGTAGSAGAYTEIVVDEDTPQVLYYQCQNHSYMGSVASILSDTSPKYLEVANSTSFITSTALSPYLEVANVATELADYWPSANIIAYTAKYLEVANNTGSSAANTSTTSATLSGTTATFTRADSSTFTLDLSSLSTGGGGASVTVSTTAPSSPSEGDLWFDSEDATMYIYYDSQWVEVQTNQQTLTPYEVNIDTFTANGTATSFGHTADVVAAKDMIVTVDGVIQRPTTDYTVSSNTVTFGSPPANTSVVAVRVTTGTQEGISNTTFQSALANTNAYIATKLDSANSFSAITVSGGNTLLTTTTGTELNIVAGNNMIIDANDATKTLTISSSASGGGGATVYVNANSFPVSASEGDLGFNANTNQLSVWDGTEWTLVQAVNVASIGQSDAITAEVHDGYEYYVFTGSGTFTVTQAGTFDVLMVGGGGATYEGGAVPPGAAGGGEVKHGEAILPVGSHTVVVGAGGTGQAVQSVNFAGGDTTITVGGVTVTAKGGGGGAYYEDGFDGGSGGAGGYGTRPSGAVLASDTTSGLWAVMTGHGNLAGVGSSISSGAGGGGGAGTAGANGGFTGTNGDGGDGGEGLYLADYQYWGENGYYGGGGGGSCSYTPATTEIGGLGGKGGGGSGQNGDDTYRNGPFGESRTNCNGLLNTGGGSGSYEDDTQQINGGSGIVIFRTVAQ